MPTHTRDEDWLLVMAFERAAYRQAVRQIWRRAGSKRPRQTGGRGGTKRARCVNPAPGGGGRDLTGCATRPEFLHQTAVLSPISDRAVPGHALAGDRGANRTLDALFLGRSALIPLFSW